MKRGWGGLVVGFSMLAGCASGGWMTRGTMVMRGESARAFAVGPAVVHAYSQDRGGRIYTTTAVTGTDADCAAALARGGATTPLPVDHVDEVALRSGQIACLATNERRPYELLWHARAAEPSPGTLAVAGR